MTFIEVNYVFALSHIKNIFPFYVSWKNQVGRFPPTYDENNAF